MDEPLGARPAGIAGDIEEPRSAVSCRKAGRGSRAVALTFLAFHAPAATGPHEPHACFLRAYPAGSTDRSTGRRRTGRDASRHRAELNMVLPRWSAIPGAAVQ